MDTGNNALWQLKRCEDGTNESRAFCLATKNVNVKFSEDFSFRSLGIESVDIISHLLREHYVVDFDKSFRITYHENYLIHLISRNYDSSLSLGLFFNGNLIGYVLGTKSRIYASGSTINVVIVNLLCIDESFRNKGLTILLSRELISRAECLNIHVGIFTGGVNLPVKVTSAQYFHYLLNVEKLIELGYCASNTLKPSYISGCVKAAGRLIHAEVDDYSKLYEIYVTKIKKYKLYEVLSEAEFLDMYITRNDVKYTFKEVVDNSIVGFLNFSVSTSRALLASQDVKSAMLNFYALECQETCLSELIIILEGMGFDVLNCVRIFDNNNLIKKFKFLEGTGRLNYYIYNLYTEEIDPLDAAIFLD